MTTDALATLTKIGAGRGSDPGLLVVETCAVGGCERRKKGRGWCASHWRRWRLYGDPLLISATRTRTLDERFWFKVQGGDAESCWEWGAGKSTQGYGIFHVHGRQTMAHRYAYTVLVADIPAGLQLDHLCRNRACVNPWHLDPVTPLVNTLRNTGPSAQNAVKEKCPAGHKYDAENTSRKGNRRVCKACARAYAQRKRERAAA